MRVVKKELIQHLKRLHCEGQFSEVVLEKKFQAAAITPDHSLLVFTDGMSNLEPLPGAVGVLDLDLLIKALASLNADDSGEANIEFQGKRIVIAEKNRGTLRLITAKPDSIGTKIDPRNLERITEVINATEMVPMPQSVVEGILGTVALLKASQVQFAGDDDGSVVYVGEKEKDHFAEFALEAVKLPALDVTYGAKTLTQVLKQVIDFTQTQVGIAGYNPETKSGMLIIKDSRFTFAISALKKADA